MKVVIRGDRGTGKSSLFSRLQGKPFSPDYRATDTLQSAKVSWNYKASNDVVNLEVWDVVDGPSTRKSSSSTLSLVSGVDSQSSGAEGGLYDEMDLDLVPVAGRTLSPQGKSTMGHLDSSNVDVLRGTHAVVLLFNPMKKWTWDYVKREIPKIPARIQVLIMANFKDVLEDPNVLTISSETVDASEVRDYIELYPDEARPIYFVEASMQNCFGLKGLKTFLNLPFLLLQRDYLETQLRQNTVELQNAQVEYKVTTEEDSYDSFVKALAAKASSPRANPANTSNNASPTISPASSTGSIPSPKAKPTSSPAAATNAPTTTSTQKKNAEDVKKDVGQRREQEKSVEAKKTTSTNDESEEAGFFSKMFGKKKEKEMVATDVGKTVDELRKLAEAKGSSSVRSVDDFVPDSDDSWLKDDDTPVAAIVSKAVKSSMAAPKIAPNKVSAPVDSDSDEDSPNPALASYSEELDESDQLMMEAIARAKAEKAEKAKQAAKAPSKPPVPVKPSVHDDDDDDDDDNNPMLAQYEDDLDLDDQQIKGKPAPKSAPAPLASSNDKKSSAASKNDSDSEDDDFNPALAAYSEDLDLADFAPTSSPKVSTPQTKSTPVPVATVSTTSMPKSNSNLPQKTEISAKVSTPVQPAPKVVASKKPVVLASNDSDSDSDNALVASDGEDSDEDYAGFVPSKAAPKLSSAVSESTSSSNTIDFNPLDADTEEDADAFWARSRQPVRKPSTAKVTSNSASSLPSMSSSSSSLGSSSQSSDPFSFGSSASPLPHTTTSPAHSDKSEKDKHHKHKDKHRKHKDKSGRGSSSAANQQPPAANYSPQTASPSPHAPSEWDFTNTHQQHLPPPAASKAPAPAPKKSIFYL